MNRPTEFKADPTVPNPSGAMTEFTVAIFRPPVEHTIRLNKVEQWAQPSTKSGSADTYFHTGKLEARATIKSRIDTADRATAVLRERQEAHERSQRFRDRLSE